MLFGLPKIVRPIWEIGLSLDLGIPMDSPHCLYRVSWFPVGVFFCQMNVALAVFSFVVVIQKDLSFDELV